MNATRTACHRAIRSLAIVLLGVTLLTVSEIGPGQNALGGERSPQLPSAGMHVAIAPQLGHVIAPARKPAPAPKVRPLQVRPIGRPPAQQRPRPPAAPKLKIVQPVLPGHLADRFKAAPQRPHPAPAFVERLPSMPERNETGRTPQVQPFDPDAYLIEGGRTGPKSPDHAKAKRPLPGQAPTMKPIPLAEWRVDEVDSPPKEADAHWEMPDFSEASRADVPPQKMPNHKPDVEQGMKPDRDGSMPGPPDLDDMLGSPTSDGRDLDGWQSWGDVPELEGGSPLDGPTNPFGPPGAWGTGSGSPEEGAGPDNGGPIRSDMPDPSSIGIDWQAPDDGISGGAKDPWGGPGEVHPGKGPAGADHVAKGKWPGGRFAPEKGSRWERITEHHKFQAEMELAEDMSTIANGGVPVFQGDAYEDPKEYYERQDEETRFRQAQEEWNRERERMKKLKEQLNRQGDSGCEGPIDTGGGFEPPRSEGDADKAKVGGNLVTDPASGQWPGGLSGVDASNHPNQASNPGYEGGSGRIDGGVKHDPSLVEDPPEQSGN